MRISFALLAYSLVILVIFLFLNLQGLRAAFLKKIFPLFTEQKEKNQA